MPIAFRSGSVGQTTSPFVTLNKPVGLVVGDSMVAFIGLSSGVGGAVHGPTGWTLIDKALNGAEYDFSAWTKTADASDVAATTFTWTGSGTAAAGIVCAYIGAAAFGAHASAWDPTSSTVHSGPGVTVTYAGSRVIGMVGMYNGITPAITGFATRVSVPGASFRTLLADKVFGPGATGTLAVTANVPGAAGMVTLELIPIQPETILQATFTFSAEGQTYRGTTSDAQSVATLLADPGVHYGSAETRMQTVARLTAEATGTHLLDFTTYDAYIESDEDFLGLIFFNDEKLRTVSRRLQPVRQDVGNNPAEIRPEFGDIFAQNDFSHGSGQTFFHQLGRDPKRYYTSEGFDISEPGRLTHLHTLAPAIEDTDTGPVAQAGGLPFVGVGTVVKRGDGNLPGVWTDEDPSAAEGDQDVLSLAAEGARLFAALGTAGVHVRSSGGVWTHHKPDGSVDLDITPATVVAWVKDRLMVIGGTDSRMIFEVVADSTVLASPIDTLKEGWMFVSIGEAGGFIEACAVNLAAGQSIIYSYGLNDTADAIERKSSTPMPIGQLAWTVAGYIGTAFIGGGKANAQGGYDPFLYRGTVNQLGEIDYTLIRQEEGSAGADLSVRAITPVGDSILVSWTLGSGATFGEARDGIAVYHLARDSFARHLRREGGGGANTVLNIFPYKGHILVGIESFGLYYENLNDLVDEATVVSSLADWNNAGNKVWDQIELSHDALPVGTSVSVDYTTKAQELEEYSAALTSQIPDSEGAVSRLSTTTSRVFALRITSRALNNVGPVIQSFAVRSHPSPERSEWDLVRFVRVLSEDQRDDQGETVFQDPREVAAALRRAVNKWVTFYESGITWTAFVTDVSAYEPEQPYYDTRSGEAVRDVFVIQLQLTGTEG